MTIGYIALYPVSKYIREIKRTAPNTIEYWKFYLIGGIIIFSFLLFYKYLISIEINSDKKYLKLVRTNIFNMHTVLKIKLSDLDYKMIQNDRWTKIILFRNGKKAGKFWSSELPENTFECVKDSLKQIIKENGCP